MLLPDADERIKMVFEQKDTEKEEDVTKSLQTKDFARQHSHFL